MSFWCGLLFVITASFSLNVLYHGLFAGVPQSDAIPKHLLGSLHQPVRNGIVPRDSGMEHVSLPVFNFHHPFTALLPAKQALEIQVEVKQEETLRRTDLELHVETGRAVVENGLTIIETGLSVVESFKIISVWNEDIEEDMTTRNELSSESFQTCPAKDAQSIKAKPGVKEERDKSGIGVSIPGCDATSQYTLYHTSIEDGQSFRSHAESLETVEALPCFPQHTVLKKYFLIGLLLSMEFLISGYKGFLLSAIFSFSVLPVVREVISLGESKDSAAKSETAPSEKEVYVNHPTLLLNLERDVVIVLAAHLTLIVSILLLGCRSLHVQKRVINDDVGIEELIVTVGLISCITVALIVLMGATITLFIRILLAKFP